MGQAQFKGAGDFNAQVGIQQIAITFEPQKVGLWYFTYGILMETSYEINFKSSPFTLTMTFWPTFFIIEDLAISCEGIKLEPWNFIYGIVWEKCFELNKKKRLSEASAI